MRRRAGGGRASRPGPRTFSGHGKHTVPFPEYLRAYAMQSGHNVSAAHSSRGSDDSQQRVRVRKTGDSLTRRGSSRRSSLSPPPRSPTASGLCTAPRGSTACTTPAAAGSAGACAKDEALRYEWFSQRCPRSGAIQAIRREELRRRHARAPPRIPGAASTLRVTCRSLSGTPRKRTRRPCPCTPASARRPPSSRRWTRRRW